MRENHTTKRTDASRAEPRPIDSIAQLRVMPRDRRENQHEFPSSSGRARILIADTSAQLRRRIRDMLTNERGIFVVGEIAQASDLTTCCVDLSPDILLFGLGNNGNSGYALAALAVMKRTVRADPSKGAIVLVDGTSAEEIVASLRAGAQGVVRRDVSKYTLLETVACVMAGGAALDPHLTKTMFEYLVSHDSPSGDFQTATIASAVRQALSPREREVLLSLARGCRNDEIAAQLGVSVGTVKTHLRHIYRKLEVEDRISAVLAAFQLRPSDAA